jgi:uncharacterized coiled-coil DUF342 family protein
MEIVFKYIEYVLGEKYGPKLVGLIAAIIAVLGRVYQKVSRDDEIEETNQKNILKQINQLDERVDTYWRQAQEYRDKADKWREKYLEVERKLQSLRVKIDSLENTISEKNDLIEQFQDREEEYRHIISKLEESVSSSKLEGVDTEVDSLNL